MRRTWMILLLLVLVVLAVRAYQPLPPEARFDPLAAVREQPDSPGARLNAIMEEEVQAEGEMKGRLQAAGSDAERRSVLGAIQGLRVYSQRLLARVREAPADPMALEALIWVVARHADTPEGQQAADRLIADHIRSEDLGSACDRIEVTGSDLAATVLRAMVRDNPHRKVRGYAEFALASLLKTRAERVGWRDPSAERSTSSEAEGLLEHIVATYGELSDGRGQRLVDLARARLDSLRTRGVGKVAPDIEGKDADDRPMHLADYRGRVVAISFWGHW